MTRIFFAGGGTGGHLYPGIAIARALVRARPTIEPFFIGAQRGIERDVLPKTEFPHVLLDLHPLYRSRGVEQREDARRRASARGGSIGRLVARSSDRRWSSAPADTPPASAMAYAVVHRIPIVQQAGDSHPGLTARAFSRWSREMYLNFPEAARALHAHQPGSLDRHRRADRAAAVAAARSSVRRDARGVFRDGRTRSARLRRQPGFAGDQSRRRASGSIAACRTIGVRSSGAPAERRTRNSSDLRVATRSRARLPLARSPTRTPRSISRSRAPAR